MSSLSSFFSSILVLSAELIIKSMLLLSMMLLISVGTVGAVRCVRTINNSGKVFVETCICVL